jgi:uncharacterized protein (DUF427 family)
MHRPERHIPGPGQESVWDYPRPPRLELTTASIEVVFGGATIVRTQRAYRVLETSHPPTYYLPPDDFATGVLHPSGHRPSFCEWKGLAVYFNIRSGAHEQRDAGWAYPTPSPGFEPIADYVALYAQLMDSCTVDGEEVEPQPGGFYGGWVTPNVVGPFKGIPGSNGW